MRMLASWEKNLLALAGNISHPSTYPLFSYWAGDIALKPAYAVCDAITAQHSKSFYLASRFLPEEKRSAIRALYAFCRTVDDIVDESIAEDRASQLDYWRDVVLYARFSEGDLVAAAWCDTLSRYHIPHRYAIQLIEGVQRDMTQSRYQTFDEVAAYSYGVASTVGLMSMHIIGFRSTEAVPYAIKLGVALQLTNILRDVGEDLRKGRVYLPREELALYAIREADMLEGRVTEAWRLFMKFQIERARSLYRAAWPGVKILSREGQLAVGAAVVFYQGILNAIEANDYDVFNHRASLNTWQKIRLIPWLLWKVLIPLV